MSDRNLFKKAAIFTDIHFGAKSNSIVHNEDCLSFVKWFISEAKAEGCETCLFLGDWHNNRATTNNQTLNYSLMAMELLNNAFEKVYLLEGNHDLYHRDKRDCSSIAWAKHLDNIVVVNDWLEIGNCVFAPWLLENEFHKLKKMFGKYLFGHFELPNFYMNSLVQAPDHGDITINHLSGFEQVYSGHFHKRQQQNNVWYVGNAFPHNFSDVGDDDRGMAILEWGHHDPTFKSWPNQPTFRQYLLSQILDSPDTLLKQNMHVRVSLDIVISFEEAQFIKETFVPQYGLREMIFQQPRHMGDDLKNGNDVSDDVFVEPVDKIILDQITNIKSDFYDPKLLLDIYKQLT